MKVTKHTLQQAERITEKYGYWSDELRNFVDQFNDYNERLKIHNHLIEYK